MNGFSDADYDSSPIAGMPQVEDDPNYLEALGADGAPDEIPAIQIVAGQLPRMATEGEAAIAASRMPVFQRGGQLVRPVKQAVSASHGRITIAAGLQTINRAAMLDILAQSARWEVWNVRKKALVPANPPDTVGAIILSRSGQWRLPSITGVTTTPTLRPDGSVLVNAGYDPVTRLYHIKDPDLQLTPVPLTLDSAHEALLLLLELIAEFPFVSPVDRAVALSAIITPVVRGAMPVVPMHAFRASTAGTGKSYLTDLVSAITTGRPCPVISIGQKDEETEKRLAGMLLAGFPIISIDNVNGELGGDLLCQAIERQLLRVRPLGASDIIEIESQSSIIANGNGLRVRGDLTRRSLISDLDANMERPETRNFRFDPLERVATDRGKYVSACLNLVRCYMAAGQPNPLPPLASFGTWSNLVRSALTWLGQPDPCASIETARAEDPDLQQLLAIMNGWEAAIGLHAKTQTRHIVQAAEAKKTDDHGYTSDLLFPDFLEALRRVASERGGISVSRLGMWIRRFEGRIAGGRRIKRHGETGGSSSWSLEPAGS